MTDKEIIHCAKSFRKEILKIKNGASENMCYMVCLPLAGILNFDGVVCELVEYNLLVGGNIYNHYAIQLSDGRILDPTADQFNFTYEAKMPQAYLGIKPEWYEPLTQNHDSRQNTKPDH